jgi:hypothetical protein
MLLDTPETNFRHISLSYHKRCLRREGKMASQTGRLSALVTLLAVAPCKTNRNTFRVRWAHSILRTNVARVSPELFSALVLVDPVIFPAPTEPGMRWVDGWGASENLIALCDGAVTRRNGWKSKYAHCCPLEVTLIRGFVAGQRLCNHSRRTPSLLVGTHSR